MRRLLDLSGDPVRLEKPAHLQRGIGVATDEIDEVPKLHRERLTAVAHERYVDRGVGPIGERLADLLVRTMAVEGDIVSKQVDLNKCRRRGDRNRPHLAVPRSTSRQRGHGARSEPERAIGDFSEAVVARPLWETTEATSWSSRLRTRSMSWISRS